ncbi:MAG: hypothetical protein ABI181_06395 [Mycobacteriaceae bacterium]
MSAVALVLLAVVGLAPSVRTVLVARTAAGRIRLWAPVHAWGLPTLQVLGLACAGWAAAVASPVSTSGGSVATGLAQVLAVLAAAGGASPVVQAVFRVARRTGNPPNPPAQELLHGGAVIGVLERAAVTATLLAGFGAGLAVVLAVKGLARYPELRDARAGEQFIIGTFASVLWAVGCWATTQALLS